MKKNVKLCFIFFCSILVNVLFSQNETQKWYFGGYAGLDFATSPPTVLTNGSMYSFYSCSSISDASGNLLFYTDGATVWDQTHAIMANGTGLFGNGGSSSSQGSIIAKQPGNTNLYYIFTTSNNWNNTNGFNYSIVDMSLAAGMGSVTVKNSNLSTGYTSGRLTATKHCNGNDIWILTRDWYYTNSSTSSGTFTPTFYAYLLTSTGVNTTPITSSAATYSWNGFSNWDWGCMKISPSGKKLGLALYDYNNFNSNNNNNFELYDFDNSTGAVTNSLALYTNTSSSNWWGGWGCEFSPDGTKFYGSDIYSNSYLYQWDLCAGSPTAIAASIYSVSSSGQMGSLQLASDGKIYCAHWGSQGLGVINNPNSSGSACNYSNAGQSTSPKMSYYSLPNFMSSYFVQAPPAPPYTYTVSNSYGCQAAAFNAPFTPQTFTNIACSSVGYSLTGMMWDFGDPASGSANNSGLTNPVHSFQTLGNYTVKLILYYSCGGGTDTLTQNVNINQPCISVASNTITCANLGSATVAATGGIGPFSYTWMPTNQTNSVATGLSPGTYTITVFDFGNNYTYTATAVFTSSVPLTGNVATASSITCNGGTTGWGNVTGIAGGSGTEHYTWFNGAITYTNPAPTNLSAGLWSLTVTDALTGCQIKQTFYIAQPPPMYLTLSSSTPTSCVNTNIVLTGTNSGGTPGPGPGYTYTWTGGPVATTHTVSHSLAGTYVYTLNSSDSYNCLKTNTIAVDFIPKPVLTVANTSICPLHTGTLIVSGATTYTWNNNGTNATTFTDNPTSTTQYTLLGSALGCTSVAHPYIVLKPLPVPILNSNSPICNGLDLHINASGGSSYVWIGPFSFNASVSNPTISAAAPSNSGVYNVTVTALNTCTAAASTTVTVNPTPTVSASGATVCITQTVNLNANSVSGASFDWKGPNAFTSLQQNPSINTPTIQSSGTYTVRATSVNGCTNSATADVTVTAVPIPIITSNSPRCFGDQLNLNGGGALLYSWSGPNGFNSSVQNPSIFNVTVPADGVYTLVVTTGPCVTSITKSVTVYALPTPTASNNSLTTPLCETKQLQLHVNNSGQYYQWVGPNHYLKFAQNPPIIDSVTQLWHAGTYTVVVTDNHGCVNTATTIVTIHLNPHVSATGATVCLNDPAILTASGAVNYVWSGPNFYFSNKQSATVTIASNVSPKTYTVIGSAANTCTDTATVVLATIPLPMPSLTALPKTKICLNETINFEGFGGKIYDWHGPGNLLYSGKTVSLVLNSMSYAGDYTLTVTDNNGCRASTLTTINIDDLPSGSIIGSSMEGCAPFHSDFKFYSSKSTSTLISTSWELDHQIFPGKSFSYYFTKAGNYIIKGNLKDTLNNCVNTETFAVNVYPVPLADFNYSPEKPVENLDEVIFTNNTFGENQSKWNWFFANNNGYQSKKENISYLFPEAGLYPVAMVVENSWGCQDTVVKVVKVESDFNVFVPNAFTPNGDDDNELFLPILQGVRIYKFIVFNRWGTKVFETSDPKLGWDGTFQGNNCKEEVYIWKITASGINGELKELNGRVTLYR